MPNGIRRILGDRRVIVALLVGYFLLAAFIGGPWFALFTGGLAVLVAGFIWWISRDKRLQVLGTVSLVIGLAMTGGGIALGQNPNLLPDEELPYRPIVPRPTTPVLDVVIPPRPAQTATPTPTPTDARWTPVPRPTLPRAQQNAEQAPATQTTRPATQPTRPATVPTSTSPDTTAPVTQPTSDPTTAPADPPPTSSPPTNPPVEPVRPQPTDPPASNPPVQPIDPPAVPEIPEPAGGTTTQG